MKKSISYCVAVKYDFKNLVSYLENNYKLTKYKNFCIIKFEEGLSFIFDYGSVVNWNLSYDDSKKILDELEKFEISPIDENIFEEFFYEEKEGGELKISNDKVYLSTTTIEEKIGVSHSMAQSIKLSYFETATQNTIEETKNIPNNLAKTGNILLKSNEISKMRGNLFMTKSRINLHYDLLDSPEFFWEYPELLKYYETTANYLEIKTRIEVLNKKLEVIHEMFQMLADEQKHKHSSLLEWIIIWLIVVEVFFTIFHDVLKLF
ncbi:MAG: RMD1 family protein [Candidatus Gracilibacteria bacterium]|nr:RMD1 family protein [Candidatus Gracilibacteria bacterium]